VRAGCTRFVSGHYLRKPQQVLADLAASTSPDLDADIYGSGSLIADFEAEVAGLFGKEAGLFFPSGTMAQPIALRNWDERRGNPPEAVPPTCHQEVDAGCCPPGTTSKR
jgi:threonine aldolase